MNSSVDSVQYLREASTVFNAAMTEFPFVEMLPKREKSKLAKLWEHLAAVRAITAEKGPVIPQVMAADLLNVGRSRVGQFVDEGRLEAVEIHGMRYVTADSVEAFAKIERKMGRPVKNLDNQSLWNSSISSARSIVENTSK